MKMVRRFRLRKKLSVMVPVAVLLVFVAAHGAFAAVQMLSPERLAGMLREGAAVWVVDVRGTAAFEQRHIEGALSIPLPGISAKKLPAQKMIVIADDSLGMKNGRTAAETISKKGHDKVFLLEGGTYSWHSGGLRLTTSGNMQGLQAVTADELAWALDEGVPVKVFDVREKTERERYPVRDGVVVPGAYFSERTRNLKTLLIEQQKNVLAGKLEKATVTVLVLPMHADARQEVESALFGVHGDVRILDGGYAAWLAKPESRVQTEPGCVACRADKPQGERK